jgi:hypothetical protein
MAIILLVVMFTKEELDQTYVSTPKWLKGIEMTGSI